MLIQSGFIHRGESAPSVTNDDLSSFGQVDFDHRFPEGVVPIVIPFVQSFNGPQTPGIRITDVTNSGFKIRLNEIVCSQNGVGTAMSDGHHNVETIGWIAFASFMPVPGS